MPHSPFDRRTFLRLLAGGATVAGLAPAISCRRSPGSAGRVVVLGLDGLEPKIVQALIDTGRHTIIESPHPSPLSAHNGFFGSRPFSRANAALVAHGQQPIDWTL